MRTLFALWFVLVGISAGAQTFDVLGEGRLGLGVRGVATDGGGYVYAVDFERPGTIGRVDPQTDSVELWADLRAVVADSTGAGGLRFLRLRSGDSLLLAVDGVGQNLVALDPGSAEVRWVKHQPSMSRPTEVAIAPNGTVYLSDPQEGKDRGRVWFYKPKGADGSQGSIGLLIDHLPATGGIEVSPLGDRLYVGLPDQRKILCYDIAPDGTVQNRRDFYEFAHGSVDGMRTDLHGNLYVARYDAGAVAVISPQGRVTQTITTRGKQPSRITFSEKMVFVTMADRGCFEVFEAKVVGRE